jgi:hypothetical protein
MKKHLALVLALVMVLTSFSFVSAAPDFSDMNDQPSAEAVARLELLNVLKGYPDGTFRPEGEITRAEFAAVAVRISGLEGAAQSAQGVITSFSDVPAWHWASGYVGIAASSGIVNGIGNGLFAPEAPVKYEEAVTMLVRALGYEPEAQAKGGYPYGYLIVAEDIDLLDGLRGSLGVNATRGLVAMLTDNALEIPMMVSVGFGDNIRWVVSGTERTEKVYLIEKMGYEPVEGRVTSFSTSRKTVTLAGEGTFDVMDSFDYLETEGVEIKAWVDKDDLVVAYVLQETVYYDAVKYDEDNDIELVTLDDVFEVDEDATLSLNEETVRFSNLSTFNANFAKVVINDDGDVIWAKGYNFDEFIVVEEVDGNEVIAYDDYNEANLKDYDLMKDGKTLEVADINEGDILFLNNSKDFGVVYNRSEMGVVDRAYNTGGDLSFRMDGSVYDVASDAVYLEEGDMGEVTFTTLEEYVDEAAEIAIFFNFEDDVVLLSGDKGTAKTSTFGLYLEAEAKTYEDARTRKVYLPLDGVNSEGASVSFDAQVTATNDFFKNSTLISNTKDSAKDKTWADEGMVIKYTIDEDGDITKIKEIESDIDNNNEFKITDRFAGSYRLKSSTVFFLLDEEGDLDEVFTLADADEYFEEVKKFDVFSDLGVYADYIVVKDSDAVADDQEVGVITRVRNMGSDFELTINIERTSYVIDVDAEDVAAGYTPKKGHIISFLINEEMDEVRDVRAYDKSVHTDLIGTVLTGQTYKLNSSDANRQFRLGTATATPVFELDNAVILDAKGTTKSVSFSDVKDGDTVNVYYEGNPLTGKVFVRYLVVTDYVDTPGGDSIEGLVTYIDGTKAVTSKSIAEGDATTLKANFNNTTDKNVSIPKDKATYQIVNNKTGAVADSGTLNDTAGLVALAGKSVELGTVNIANTLDDGAYTIIVTVEDANENIYEAELALTVLNNDASLDATKLITVKGEKVEVDAADPAYKVALPFGTDLSKLVASDVVVNTTDAKATVGTATIVLNKTGEVIDDATVTVVVTPQSGADDKVTYTITVSVADASTATTLTSTTYVISGTSITMPATADVAVFKANITAAAGATFEVQDSAGAKKTTGDMVTGDKVVVTAQDGSTTATYTVTVQ